jgi:hypothetical protein
MVLKVTTFCYMPLRTLPSWRRRLQICPKYCYLQDVTSQNAVFFTFAAMRNSSLSDCLTGLVILSITQVMVEKSKADQLF